MLVGREATRDLDVASWDERLHRVSRKWVLNPPPAPKTSRCERRSHLPVLLPPAVDALAIE